MPSLLKIVLGTFGGMGGVFSLTISYIVFFFLKDNSQFSSSPYFIYVSLKRTPKDDFQVYHTARAIPSE